MARRAGRQERPAAAFHIASRLSCPFPAEAVDWRNADVSAPSYRRVSARRIILADRAPGPGEVGHDDAANPIAAARPLTVSSALASFVVSMTTCGIWWRAAKVHGKSGLLSSASCELPSESTAPWPAIG